MSLRLFFIFFSLVMVSSCITKDRSFDWQSSLKDSEYVAIDVRTAKEVVRNPAEGSVNIPLREINGGIDGVEKSKTILLFCEAGVRSHRATRLLRKEGFEKVINIGSWRDWNRFYQQKKE